MELLRIAEGLDMVHVPTGRRRPGVAGLIGRRDATHVTHRASANRAGPRRQAEAARRDEPEAHGAGALGADHGRSPAIPTFVTGSWQRVCCRARFADIVERLFVPIQSTMRTAEGGERLKTAAPGRGPKRDAGRRSPSRRGARRSAGARWCANRNATAAEWRSSASPYAARLGGGQDIVALKGSSKLSSSGSWTRIPPPAPLLRKKTSFHPAARRRAERTRRSRA